MWRSVIEATSEVQVCRHTRILDTAWPFGARRGPRVVAGPGRAGPRARRWGAWA